VLVPLVVNQMRRRHQIEHGRNDAAVQLGRRDLAVFWKSLFVLRPQPVDDKLRIAALVLGRCPARRPPRRRTATTTGTERRSRSAPPRAAEPLRQARAAWRREVPNRPKRREDRTSA
jgi:hypothetical protein